MATNHYENVLPDDSTSVDIVAILAALAASIGQYVPVASRTEANQRLAEKGTGTGPLLVIRTDIKKVEVHPNTGASGEGWLTVSPPDQITSKDVWIKHTAPGGAADDYTIHELFQEAFGKRQLASSGTVEINLTGNQTPNSSRTFDTGDIALTPSFNQIPAVLVEPYISPAGEVVTARAVAVTTSSFRIRTNRPTGYNPGAITFRWIAVGERGGNWNDGQ